jgi:hypothetical protein
MAKSSPWQLLKLGKLLESLSIRIILINKIIFSWVVQKKKIAKYIENVQQYMHEICT